MDSLKYKLIWTLLLTFATILTSQAQNYTKPKVRAITAFVRLDRGTYTRQIAEALAVLRATKQEFAKQGYDVQTIRIVTQPLAELVSGLPEPQALSFLKAIDDLSPRKTSCPASGRR